MKKLLITVAAAGLALAGAAGAGTVRLDASGGGNQQVYQLGNGNYLGLLGIDARGAQYDASTISEADLLNSIQQPGSVVNFYNGTGLAALTGGNEFDAVSFDVVGGPSDGKIFEAVWVEWTGGLLGLLKWSADGSSSSRSGTLADTATLQGDPLAPVPLPAALPLLLAGIGGLGLMGRRRKKA